MDETRTVTVLATGAIGTASARALVAAGHDVTVWNRTPPRTAEAVSAGARAASSPAEAVAAGELVLVAATDHHGARQVLDGARPHLAGRTVVLMTTSTPDESRSTAARVAAAGAAYLDVGVQTGPDDVGTPAATFVVSGDHATYARHEAVLATLGTFTWVGDAAGAAAEWDLALLGVWYDAQVGLLRALATVADPTAFATAARTQLGHVVAGVAATVDELAAAEVPRGPADLTEHLSVVESLVATRSTDPLGTGGLERVRDRLAELVELGHGREGLTRVARPD